MSASDSLSSPVEVSGFAYVVGVDIGSQSAVYCVCQPDKSQVVKPTELANSRTGFEALDRRLRQLAVPPQRILIGLEATGHYSENLYQFLQEQGYCLCLLHPRRHTSSLSNAACAPRPTDCMPPPLHACCSGEKHVQSRSLSSG